MEFHSSSSLLSLCFYFSTTLLSLSHPPPVFLLAQPSALLQHLGQAFQPSLDSSPGFTAVLRGIHLNCYGVGQKPGLADADLGLGVGVMSGPGAEGGEPLPAILGVRERVMGSSPGHASVIPNPTRISDCTWSPCLLVHHSFLPPRSSSKTGSLFSLHV